MRDGTRRIARAQRTLPERAQRHQRKAVRASGAAAGAAVVTVVTGALQAITGANLAGIGAALVLVTALALVVAAVRWSACAVLRIRYLAGERTAPLRTAAPPLPDYPVTPEWYRANGMPLAAEVAERLAGTPAADGYVRGGIHSVICQWPTRHCTCGATADAYAPPNDGEGPR